MGTISCRFTYFGIQHLSSARILAPLLRGLLGINSAFARAPRNQARSSANQQWRSQPDSLVPLCKFQVIFKLLSLFISLEINCFHSQ